MAELELTPPETDVFLAKQRKLRLTVCGKEKPRGRWLDLVEGYVGLPEAMALVAKHKNAYAEVGVFVHLQAGDGFLYWTSNEPDLWNSTVLRIEGT